jgi:hypothetical protein
MDEKKVEGKLELAHDEMQKMEEAMKKVEEGLKNPPSKKCHYAFTFPNTVFLTGLKQCLEGKNAYLGIF